SVHCAYRFDNLDINSVPYLVHLRLSEVDIQNKAAGSYIGDVERDRNNSKGLHDICLHAVRHLLSLAQIGGETRPLEYDLDQTGIGEARYYRSTGNIAVFASVYERISVKGSFQSVLYCCGPRWLGYPEGKH
ncbi:MAG: hypothetical protein QXO03_02390, partial [Thermoplasmatales archaeon]